MIGTDGSTYKREDKFKTYERAHHLLLDLIGRTMALPSPTSVYGQPEAMARLEFEQEALVGLVAASRSVLRAAEAMVLDPRYT